MEKTPMGRFLTAATIESLRDLFDADRGRLPLDQVRRLTLTDALVDTGASMLCLPTRMIRQLGLNAFTKKRFTTCLGVGNADVYEAVRLTIKDRSCTMDVLEVPDTVPALIGQLPLEALDFVVDPKNCSLIGNPAHGGEHIIEAF